MQTRLLIVPFFLLGALFAASARAQTTMPLSSLDKTLPPANERAVLTVLGRGVQIYACRQVGSQYQWQFLAPSAHLFANGAEGEREVGTHGDGPVWTYQDRSSIHGQVSVKQPSAEADAVPWLLLKGVSPTGPGLLSSVDLIRRSETHGGAAPSKGCSSDHIDERLQVPYTATYTFYSSK